MILVFWFYSALSIVLSPFVRLWVSIRLKRGLEDSYRFKERFGIPSLVRPQGRVVWFHAASVGETVSLVPLLKLYKAHYPEHHLLLTTTTVTAYSIVQQRLQGICCHQYIPFDVYSWVGKFLKFWQPSVAIFTESELWPNLIHQTKRRHIPLVLLNARLSDRSYQRWRSWRWFAKALLKNFTVCLAPSEVTAKRLRSLGAPVVEPCPHLKFAAEPLPVNKEHLAEFKALLANRSVWVAASTHPGEEEQILKAHQALKKHFPDLLTVLVPRHPSRASALIELSYRYGENEQTVCLHSHQRPTSQSSLWLVNTIGELGLFFRLTQIVFIGGSLVPVGGHNLIEPAMLGCVVLYGPHMHNFQDVCQILQDVTLLTATPEKLVEIVTYLLNHKDTALRLGQQACQTVQEQAESLESLVIKLAQLSLQPRLSFQG